MLCKGDEPVRADERRLNWQRTLTQTLHAAERYSENEYDEYAEYDEEEYDEEEESPVQELLELMDAELADLLTPEHAMLAFELVCDTAMMFESADEILEQEDIEDACRDAWMQILAIAAPDQQSAMYEWFAAAFRTWKPMTYFTAPLAFLFSYPWDEAIHQRNLALLDEKIAEWKLNAQERGGGAMVNLLNQREKTMQQLHASQEDIISFWHSHWDVPYAHDRTLKTLMAAEKWTEAIEQVKADLQTFAGEYMPCKQRREQRFCSISARISLTLRSGRFGSTLSSTISAAWSRLMRFERRFPPMVARRGGTFDETADDKHYPPTPAGIH